MIPPERWDEERILGGERQGCRYGEQDEGTPADVVRSCDPEEGLARAILGLRVEGKRDIG